MIARNSWSVARQTKDNFGLPAGLGLWKAHGFSIAAAATAFLAVVFLSGCTHVKVTALDDVPLRPTWTVVILPLDDSGAEQTLADYTFYGRTGSQGSGSVVARYFRRALLSSGRFRQVERDALRRAMREEKLELDRLALLDPADACRVGRKVNADMVVMGQVRMYRTAWVLFVPRARVDFELRAFNPESGAQIWSAEAATSATFSTDNTLAVELVESIAAELQGNLFRADAQ